MLEEGLITYCAPTLAGIKSANLFNYRIRTSKKEVLCEIYELNRKLNDRGVRIETLLWKDSYVLIYVYRPGFLGYPLADVIGFIDHKGRDCKCCGIWKVYCNENEARKVFCRLEKCTQVYQRVFANGRNIEQMTVSAS